MKKNSFFSNAVMALVLVCCLVGFMILPVAHVKNQTKAAETGSLASSTATSARKTSKNIAAKAAASGSAIETRAVWIAYIDYAKAGLYNKNEATFTANADKLFKSLKKDKINTVYFHVAARNDAIYPSKYVKWSKDMAPRRPGYNPMKILISKCHKYGMSFHAWINPYRKTMTSIYNPASTSSKNRVVNIVKEIIKNYNVDGIHFDDYFYPSKSKGNKYYKVSISKRKKVINSMVKKVYKTVKAYDPSLQFGISPAGNVEYAKSLGCDLSTWLSKPGYVDYIVPQIYWSDNYKISGAMSKMYSYRLKQWIKMNKNNTPMYIGLALYKGGCREALDRGWRNSSKIIVKQIKQERAAGADGFALFSYASFKDPAPAKEVKNYRAFIR